MKKYLFLPLVLLPLAAVTGFLLSKASFVGRAGITLFFQEYKFLKTWWQAALVVWAVWLLLFILQNVAAKKLSGKGRVILRVVLILLGFAGFYFTWQDFHHNVSHRLLGKRFHAGGYLFWLGWFVTVLFGIKNQRKQPQEQNPPAL